MEGRGAAAEAEEREVDISASGEHHFGGSVAPAAGRLQGRERAAQEEGLLHHNKFINFFLNLFIYLSELNIFL